MTFDEAETIGAEALGFIAGQPATFERFCTAAGTNPQAIASQVGERDTLAAVLRFLVDDDSLLLSFSAARGHASTSIMRAHHTLAGDLAAHDDH
ncbi:MAG: DUF3572 family protein [Pseudomonadota bacterium]